LPAARIAHAVGPLVQLRECTFSALQTSLERLAYTDVGQPTHRLDGAIADPLPEADGAAALRMLREDAQTLAVTVPARFKFSANRIKVKITRSHAPTIASSVGRIIACLIASVPMDDGIGDDDAADLSF
jgi:hypothetical protein